MRFLRWTILAASLVADAAAAQSVPTAQYLILRDTEISLATSAAPPSVSADASIMVLARDGYQVVRKGRNGFTCLVLRSFGAPSFGPAEVRDAVFGYSMLRAPVCYNPAASRAVLPYQMMRARLGMSGKSANEIAKDVSYAYATGALPRIEETGFAYMLSAHQDLGPGAGTWRPHMMVFVPYAENASMGGNPFGGPLPFVSDDPGTPFAVTLIPVDPALAIAPH